MNMLPEMLALMEYDPSVDALLRRAHEREVEEAALPPPVVDDGSLDWMIDD